MTELKVFEKEVLSKAYTNHVQEKREAPTYRVCIKAPFNQRPVEVTGDDSLISGFTKGDWLHFRDMNVVFNSIPGTKAMLEGYLKSHFPEKIDWGFTNTLGPEIFYGVGFVFAMSHQFYVRYKAEELAKEWQSQGLDCFLHAELPEGADLYSWEALEEKYSKHIDTSHLSFSGDPHRAPGSIETALRGRRKDSAAKARSQVDEAFEALEKEGLAIHIKGKHLFWEWDGVSLTEAGVKLVEEMKDEATEEPPRPQGQPEVIPPDAILLKCPNCAGIFYRITEAFNSEVQPTGDMFKLLPQYGLSGSGWDSFNLNDSGENLICPGCDEPYTDPQGFLKEDVLVPAKDYLPGS